MTRSFIPVSDPWDMFADWFALAQQSEPVYADAMSLATVGDHGTPAVRTVLMKGYDRNGIVFYSNRDSRKGRQLAANPKAALCFYWKSQQRQIHLEGDIAFVDDSESDAYFATRPRGSQIGAWASQQSRPVSCRGAMEQAVKDIENRYTGQTVPRPPHWGGYRLTPNRFEFWQEALYRLHDRVLYRKQGEVWQHERLYP